MKFPRNPRALHLRSAKFAPFAIISLFFLTNFTGLFFSPVLAPTVSAATQVETIPADIPLSGDCDLDWTQAILNPNDTLSSRGGTSGDTRKPDPGFPSAVHTCRLWVKRAGSAASARGRFSPDSGRQNCHYRPRGCALDAG